MINVARFAMYYMGKDQAGNGGVLVNIAQYVDYGWTAQLAVYTATKHAIIGLSQSLGVSLLFIVSIRPKLLKRLLQYYSKKKLLEQISFFF